MRDRVARARAIQEKIGRILLKDWDPIGLRDSPAAETEYEGYVGGVYRLLTSGASEAAIAAHLGHIAHTEMGLSRSESHDVEAARRLKALDVNLGDPPQL